MQYELHLNLQKRSVLRIAISLWERKKIRDAIKEFLKSCDKCEIHEAGYKWHKFTKKVVDEWDEDVLPRKLEIELIHIVKMIGDTIFNWCLYVKHELGINEALNCIDNIHWTPYGTVDAVKVFKSCWLNNPNISIIRLYSFACSHVLEEYINDLWQKIPGDVQDRCFNDSYHRLDQHILAYWQCYRDNDLHNLIRYFAEAIGFNRENVFTFDFIYNPNLSPEINMFRWSVYHGHVVAVKYFWEKFTEKERNDNILKYARMAVICYHYYQHIYGFHNTNDKNIDDSIKSRYVEINIFLMNQMTNIHKKAFFNKKLISMTLRFSGIPDLDVKDIILRMLLSTWPWEELFISVLNDMLQYQDDESPVVCKFLDVITDKMVKDAELDYSVENSKYRSLLREAWLMIPGSIKQKIVQMNTRFEFINNLLYVADIDDLKLILNDPAIVAVRDQFIDLGSESYIYYAIEDQFDVLDELIKEICKSEKEKKLFKQKIKPWYEFIASDRFDMANKMLDWQCSTPEERRSVKNNVDHIQICKHLIDDYAYELVKKFLDWRFETEEEKINCKNHFKSDIYSTRRVCFIWLRCGTNIDEAKNDSSQFLHWVFTSEEEIAYFKREIEDKFDVDHDTTCYLVKLHEIGTINHFYSWCGVR